MNLPLIVNTILITLTLCASIFCKSELFTDRYILPKWIISGILIFITINYNIIFYYKNKLKNIFRYDLIVKIIIAAYSIESIYGILQGLNIVENKSKIGIIGTFDNPAGFSCCICICFPFLIYTFKNKSKAYKYISIIILAISAFAIILSKYRTGEITFIITLYYIILKEIDNSKIFKYGSIIAITIIIIALFSTKKNSTNGRLLIWNCSIDMIKDAPMLGKGIFGFEKEYMNYQAKYFCKNPKSTFSNIADNVTHPFNEYIYIIVNYGILSFIILVYLASLIYRSYKKDQTILKSSCLSSLISLSIFALFSYPLRYPLTWIILIFNTLYLIKNTTYKIKQHLKEFHFIKKYIIYSIFIINVFFIYRISIRLYKEKEWNEIAKLDPQCKECNIVNRYNDLFGYFKHNQYFLYNYAIILNENKKYLKSNEIIRTIQKKYNDYDIEMLLANNYINTKDTVKSEINFNIARFMCPNRFLPLYNLFKIEEKAGRNNAIYYANLINKKSTKINSLQIEYIKEEIKYYLQNKSRRICKEY